MNKYPRSCFYFPSTFLILGSNKTLLEPLFLPLKDKLSIKLSDNVDEALQIIKNNYVPSVIKNGFLKKETPQPDDEENEYDYKVVTHVKINHIAKEIYRPKRFSHISTIVFDADMPRIDGLAFNKLIRMERRVKIMLTNKSNVDEIHTAWREAQIKYFEDVSHFLLMTLSANKQCILRFAKFWHVFNSICHEKQIVEYYLLDKKGSFILFDRFANPYWLIVRSDADFSELYDVAIGNRASSEIIADIQSNRTLPILIHEADFELPVQAWATRSFKMTPFPGIDKFYYTVIANNKVLKIDQTKILSYQGYLAR